MSETTTPDGYGEGPSFLAFLVAPEHVYITPDTDGVMLWCGYCCSPMVDRPFAASIKTVMGYAEDHRDNLCPNPNGPNIDTWAPPKKILTTRTDLGGPALAAHATEMDALRQRHHREIGAHLAGQHDHADDCAGCSIRADDREVIAQLREELEALKDAGADLDRQALLETIAAGDDERDALRKKLEEARNWARHGYEIGQRSCLWADHGVAPTWLTEGWPHHFDADPLLEENLKLERDLEAARAELKRERDTHTRYAEAIETQLNKTRTELDEATKENRHLRDKLIPKGFGQRNTHCSNCGDERGGPAGHEISECRYRAGMTAAEVAEILPEHRRAAFWELSVERYLAMELDLRGLAPAAGDTAGQDGAARPCSCGGTRWVDDENWQPEQWELQRGRIPRSGRIPCGLCNHGGWDAPDGAQAGQDAAGGEGGDQADR